MIYMYIHIYIHTYIYTCICVLGLHGQGVLHLLLLVDCILYIKGVYDYLSVISFHMVFVEFPIGYVLFHYSYSLLFSYFIIDLLVSCSLLCYLSVFTARASSASSFLSYIILTLLIIQLAILLLLIIIITIIMILIIIMIIIDRRKTVGPLRRLRGGIMLLIICSAAVLLC